MRKTKRRKSIILVIILVFITIGTNIPVLATDSTYTDISAEPVQYILSVDGEEMSMWAYEIDDGIFFKLRDIAIALNETDKQFDISWDGTDNTVSLNSRAAYMSVGDELSEPDDSVGNTAYLSDTDFYMDGIRMPVRSYLVNDNHYINMDDLAPNLLFSYSCDEEKHTVKINTREIYSGIYTFELPESRVLLANLPDDNIAVYGDKNNLNKYGDLYEGMYLSINGINRYFEWENLVGSFDPELTLVDLNGDGKKELVVVLTTASGTGVYISDIHVIDPEDFKETNVVNPLDIVSENVDSSIIQGNGTVIVSIIVNKQEYVITLPENYAQGWAEDEVSYGNIVNYSIDGTKLKATVPLQVSNTVFVGEINITYAFDGDNYIMDKIEYSPYDLE